VRCAFLGPAARRPRVEALRLPGHEQVGGDRPERAARLDAAAALAREPEEAAHARVLAHDRHAVGREGAQPGPLAAQRLRHERRREPGKTREALRDHLVVGPRVARLHRLLVHRAQQQSPRLGREVEAVVVAVHHWPAAHIDWRGEGHDRAPVGDERDRRRAGERGELPGPGAGGVHHPARVDLALRRHHTDASSRLDPHAAHLGAEALLGPAPLRVAQVAPEERVHVDVAVVGEEGRAREALREERGHARDRLGR